MKVNSKPVEVTTKYLDITLALPYQRNFIFVNGSRSIGKTYSTLKWVIKQCKEHDCEFVYIVRTQDEKRAHALEMAVQKVCINEYPAVPFIYDIEKMQMVIDEDEKYYATIGYCIALSEVQKIKKRAYPKVKYMIFDEYMLEKKDESSYIGGWNEPDKLLSLYHTIDREEDRVIVFLLGNNTSFYNPYHLHPAFNIPMIPDGHIWMSENVIFWRACPSAELKESRKDNKFLKMLEGSSYGDYAVQGEYIYDNVNLVEPLPATTRYVLTMIYKGKQMGIYVHYSSNRVFISEKIDPSCKRILALTPEDVDEGIGLGDSRNTFVKWLKEKYKAGLLRYDAQETKSKFQLAISSIL